MRRTQIFAGMVLLSLLVLAACGGTSTGGDNGTPAASATTAATATATAKPKPTGLPAVTQAFCQNIMSLSEANSLMNPSSPATTLQASYNGSNYGVCNYLAGNALVLKIFLDSYTGPVPVPQSTLEDLLSQLASGNDVTINSATTVSGVGDQAAYLDATAAGGGYTLLAHVFYTIDGGILFGCLTYVLNGVGTNGTQAQLQQCATQVVSRL